MRISYCLMCLALSAVLTLFSDPGALAQSGKTQTVKGRVTEAVSGEPIPGAAVMVKSTNTGVVTDVDGDFVIGVNNPNATLV